MIKCNYMSKMDSKISNSLLRTTLSSFIATVLGIVLTFGVSKMVEIKSERDMQRQCVYNVLSDLRNASRFVRKDSTRIAELGEWLPDLMEAYSEGVEYSVDSAYAHFCETNFYPLYMKSSFDPVGNKIMSSVVPANEKDMAIHRTMELSYEYLTKIQRCSDQLFELVEYMRQKQIKLSYTPTAYEMKDVVELFMTDDKIVTLTEMVWQLDGAKIYGTYIQHIQLYYDTILKMSGITEEEVQNFLDNVDKMQGR